MKKHIKLFSSISLFLALSIPVFSHAAGGDDDVRKKKTISKSYNVSSEDKLEIENQFGNVVVSTWEKNEISVDIEMSAKASSEAKAQDIMDEIDVKELHDGHIISFKTKVGEIHNNDNNKHKNGDEDRSFYIDYVIHMPAGNRLRVENSFGKINIPDFGGEVNLTSKFGSLSAGKLSNVDAIDVEFGRVNIAEIMDGKVVFKFNKESNIGKVSGNVKITSEFSHNVQFNVGDNIKELSVFESYSGVRMIVAKSLSAEFEVHTSFGHFRNESEFSIHERRDDENESGPRFDKDYSGKAGDGRAHIRIKSSFGDVRLTHIAGASSSKDKKDKGDKDDKDDEKDEKDEDSKTS